MVSLMKTLSEPLEEGAPDRAYPTMLWGAEYRAEVLVEHREVVAFPAHGLSSKFLKEGVVLS